MAKLRESERAKLPDSAFAYIDSSGHRRLPIHDEAHVRNALSRFERVAFESEAAREKARGRLLNAAKRHGIVPVGFITGQLRSERATRSKDLAALPTGAVTFLMTDMEGSTVLLHRLGDRYAALLNEVRRIHRRIVRNGQGHEIDARADEYFACFERPGAAIEAATAIHRRMNEQPWADGVTVRIRAGIHGGRPALTDAGYVGLSVNTVARICSAAHGGQTLVSERSRAALKAALPTGVRLRSIGSHLLAGLPNAQRLYQLEAKGLPSTFPPPRIGGGSGVS